MHRFFLALLLATLARAEDNHDFGAVTPVLLPNLPAHRHDGTPTTLQQLLSGRRSALQFVFTDCPTTCPLLASLFHRVDLALPPADPSIQLITITVDPTRDTPAHLTEWLAPFHPSPRWTALRLSQPNLLLLLAAFNLKPGAPAAPTLQIFLTDPQARYYSRTTALPTATTLTAALTNSPISPPNYSPKQAIPTSGPALYFGQSPLQATVGRCASCHAQQSRRTRRRRKHRPPTPPHLPPLPTPPPRRPLLGSFCQSLQSGQDPAGVQFSPVMPRYQLSSTACHQLWQFLISPLP